MALESDNKIGLAPGFVVDGRYRVVRVLDLGGTGVVHHVEHVQTGRGLALKTLLDTANEGRLEQEARAASTLRNPHAVKVVDMGRAADVGPYIVMELLEGTNLRALLDDAGQLPIEVAASIALQVCECLDEAHAGGIIHRDLKPGNIHLTPSFNSSYHVTVLDFGAVKLQGPLSGQLGIGSNLSPNEELTRVGSTVGTPFYMSLEQLRGNASVDGVSDVYSLSVVLYEMLAGTRPFQADTLGDLVYALVQTKPPSLAGVRPDLPPDLAEIVTRGLAPRREDRPQSARDVARILAPLAEPAASMWMRAPVAGRQMTGAMPAVPAVPGATPLPGAVVPPPAPSRPGLGSPGSGSPASGSSAAVLGTAPPGVPRALGAPGLQPPPRPQPPRATPPAAPAMRSGPALGAPTFGPKPPVSTASSENSALTFLPAANLPALQEQPTSALPVVDAQAAGLLPDLELDLGAGASPRGAAPPPPPSSKRAHPPPIKRQDTPTEMYAQGVHDSPSTADLPDLGDLVSSPTTADAPPARPSPPPRGGPPASTTSDDDSTSVLDLDALKAASLAKAAAAKTTPPPPAFGIAPGTLPPGATETMRLDIESPSGPMPLQKLGLEGISLDLGSLPEPPKPADPGPVREAPAFDPTQIGLADNRVSMPGPASPRASLPGAAPQHPYAVGAGGGAMPGAAPISGPQPAASDAPRVKPAWQGAVDQGMVDVSRSTTEAIGRFFVWFRKLNTGEQTTFVVCTVLGFLIVLMLTAYVILY